MSLLQELGQGQGYLKAGFLGFNKSGKTRTAIELAIGTRACMKNDAPIAMYDTEGGSEYIADLILQRTGKKLLGIKSRSFNDLLTVTHECESGGASVLVIDSITHVWRNLTEGYKAKTGRKRLRLLDIMTIKDLWAPWTDLYLNAKIHIIICGRAGFEWNMEENEEGEKELTKTGVKMKVESEFGFEPSLLVEMERVQKIEEKTQILHRATVIGDRYGLIDGQQCDDPTFEFFRPHIERLKPTAHSTINVNVDVNLDIDDNGETNFYKEKQLRKIQCEEIQSLLMEKFPSTKTEDKLAKAKIIRHLFNTGSWTEVENTHSNLLKKGVTQLRELLNSPDELTKIIEVALQNEESK